MTGVVMTFMLVLGAVLQAVVPSWAILGEARIPILLGCVLYYALTRPRNTALQAAILAGLLQDALCMIPLGYSSFCFCIVALLANRVKDEVFSHQWFTHLLFGAVANGGMMLVLYVLLVRGGVLSMAVGTLVLRTFGAMLLGAVVTPVTFHAAQVLERRLGLMEVRRVH
jgi:rod shape-determining protein MreD